MIIPSPAEFETLASGAARVPVYRDILSDFQTPLAAYWKLAHDERFSFLLESVTGGEQLARYSIIGIRPKAVLFSKGTSVKRVTEGGEEHIDLERGEDPLQLVKEELAGEVHSTPGMPKFVGGAVGMIAYDYVRFIERIPADTKDDLHIDDIAMMIADTVVVFDHAKNSIRVIVVSEPNAVAYGDACAQIEDIVRRLGEPVPTLPAGSYGAHPVTSNRQEAEFGSAIDRARQYIAEGDCIQVVLSQRFQTQVEAHPLTIYRSLRSLNPSPYMYLLRLGDYDVVGASPEILVSKDGDTARVRPIAGTRWRGDSQEEDNALAEELLADEKERAEHIMLVDLGRNDLGRVSSYGSVSVNQLMVIERYSHVMHIVSDVTSRVRPELDAFDLIRATFPAGTVSGAPKVRAMEIIDELEPTRRGCYAGAIGYIGYDGNTDMCIAIRTILIKDGVAYVQAGAGIVYDSIAEREIVESKNKAMACMKAIELAQRGLDA